MGRNMLKWRRCPRYRLRDAPYAPLVESPDTTDAGYMKQRLKTTALQNIRSSDQSKATVARRATINSATKSTSDVLEQSSFVTISSEELNFEDSDSDSDSEYEKPQHVTRNTFRRFSESSMASVAKMSNKWSKIRDSFIPVRKSLSTLPEILNNSARKTTSGFVKPDAGVSKSGKNPLQRIKRTNSLRNRQRRWSLFSTNYVKLNNSDSSPSMPFGLEDIAHSTFIQESKDKQADKRNCETGLECLATAQQPPVGEQLTTDTSLGCIPKHPKYVRNEVGKKLSLHKNKRRVSNAKRRAVRTSAGANISSERNIQRIKTKRLQGSMGTTRLPNTRRKDSYSLRTLSVKSSEGKVEVKISLELSDGRKECKNSSSDSSRSGVTNKYYLRSPLRTLNITPVLPKRPLSRRSLFSDGAGHGETITDREIDVTGDNKGRWNDSSSVSELNAEHSAQDNSLHLSPLIVQTDHIITPPNRQELTLSIEQLGRQRPRRVRKPRGMRC